MRISDWSSDVCSSDLTVGRPAIFVPIPHGGSREEQRRNADTLAEAGVGWCVPEPEFTVEKLSALLGELFASTIKLPQAAVVAASMGRPRAAAEDRKSTRLNSSH